MAEIICGIYKIENMETKDFYIGSSNNIYKRFYQHKNKLLNNTHKNPILQSSWNKYGEQCFNFKALIICSPKDLLYYEQLFIDKLSPKYNIVKITISPMRGRKHSEETKIKMKIAHINRKTYPELENTWKNPVFKGKTMPDDVKEKIRKSKLGQTHNDETKEKVRKAMLGKIHNCKTYSGLISPEGIVYKSITNLAKFGREHNLNPKYLNMLFTKTKSKIKSHKGWKKYEEGLCHSGN